MRRWEKTHRSSIGPDSRVGACKRPAELEDFASFFSGTGDKRVQDTCQEDYTSKSCCMRQPEAACFAMDALLSLF